ncbi:MAG: TRAP transporter large permease [bacterium]|jgi:tripartite ATP-independent transporter DctM subunit
MELIHVFVLALSFAALLLLGVPISFAIGIATIVTMLMSIDPMPAFTTVAQQMATGLDSFALLAIPFFIFAGLLMNRGGIARRLIDLAKVIVGGLPGGMAFVTILACMLFGAISGSAVAAAAAIGGFMIPLMVKDGYDRNFSAAVNISSSTTGLIIPPSNILIVYSFTSGTSVAALFLAGYIPGILIGLGLMVVAGIVSHQKNYPTCEPCTLKEAIRIAWKAIPSIFLIILVMGGIVVGIFTATEASAIAVAYAFVLAVLIYREVKWSELPGILLDTATTTAIVMLLIGTSIAMSWIMSYENIPQNISAGLISLTDNRFIILLLINVILLAVGTFMDMTPAVLIFTPIFLPVAEELGIHPVHFGIFMVTNLCIGLCTPPVGSVLFVGTGIAETSIMKVIRPLIPMYAAMVIVLLLIIYVPWLSLFLPRLFGY